MNANKDEQGAGATPRRSRLRRLRRGILKFGVCYCLLAIALSGCADSLVLHPTTEVIPWAADRRLEIAGPEGPIEIFRVRSSGAQHREPVAFAMTFVGNASRAEFDLDPIAEVWGDRPVEIWAVNYPGYGSSAGKATLKSIGPASLAAYDAMKKVAGNRPIFVGGRSLGTTAALHVAAERDVNGVILYSPPPLRNLIMGRFGWWNLWVAAIPVALGIPGDLDSIANGKRVHAPGIFLITEADSYVTPHYQNEVVDAFAGSKRVIALANADHNDRLPATAVPPLRAALDWLLAQTPGESARASKN